MDEGRGGSPEIDRVATEIDTRIDRLRQLAEDCAKKDSDQIDEHGSFWDEVGNAIKNTFTGKNFWVPVISPGGAVIMSAFSANEVADATRRYYEGVHTSMWKAYDDMVAVWNNDLRTGTVGAAKLSQKAVEWKQEQDKNIEQMLTGLNDLEKQDHWKGDGHDAYKAAIPSQRGALNEMSQLVQRSADVYKKGSVHLGLANTNMRGIVDSSVLRIQNLPAPADTRHWCTRMKAAQQTFVQVKQQFDNSVTELRRFGEDVHTVQNEIRHATAKSVPFAEGGGTWPQAKGDQSHMAPASPHA
ncbi:hypothetical protein [Mariniluteicoccus flavus]